MAKPDYLTAWVQFLYSSLLLGNSHSPCPPPSPPAPPASPASPLPQCALQRSAAAAALCVPSPAEFAGRTMHAIWDELR